MINVLILWLNAINALHPTATRMDIPRLIYLLTPAANSCSRTTPAVEKHMINIPNANRHAAAMTCNTL